MIERLACGLGGAVALILLLGAAGCGTKATNSPTPVTYVGPPTRTSEPVADPAVIAADTKILAAAQYTVVRHVAGALPSGALFYVFHSVCTGSADGHCQAVDAFVGAVHRARWHRQFAGVSALLATPTGFSLRVTGYRPADPLCCPSGSPLTHTFRWNGQSFVELTPPTG